MYINMILEFVSSFLNRGDVFLSVALSIGVWVWITIHKKYYNRVNNDENDNTNKFINDLLIDAVSNLSTEVVSVTRCTVRTITAYMNGCRDEHYLKIDNDLQKEEGGLLKVNNKRFSYRQPQEKPLGVQLAVVPTPAPEARVSSSMAFDDTRGLIFLYGGRSGLCSEGGKIYADLNIYDPDALIWEEAYVVENELSCHPGPRHSSSLTYIDNKLILIGGSTPDHEFTNDVYVLNLIHSENCCFEWSQLLLPDDEQFPIVRTEHAVTTLGEKLILFGGRGLYNKPLNDMWVLDTVGLDNTKGITLFNLWWKIEPTNNHDNVLGESFYWPEGRFGHCIVSLANRIYLMGGRNKSQDISSPSCVDVFDFDSKEWQQEITCGRQPPLRLYSTAHSIELSKKILTICNGCYSKNGVGNRMDLLDTSSKPMTWTNVSLESWCGDWTIIPGARSLFTSAYDPSDNFIYIFGGQTYGAGERKDNVMIHDSLVMANFEELVSSEDNLLPHRS